MIAAAMVALACFGIAMTYQTLRAVRAEKSAREEAGIAKQVSEFLSGLFKVANPSEAKGNSITARKILDKGAEKFATDLKDQPLVQARLMETMGNVYVSLGLYGKAEPLFKRSLAIRKKTLGYNHPEVARVMFNLGQLYREQKRLDEAEALFKSALVIYIKATKVNPERVADTLLEYAKLLRTTHRAAEAEKLETRAQALKEGQRQAQGIK